MRPYHSLQDPANVDELLARVARVGPASVRQWGTMTPHGMLCHLSDAFLVLLGEKRASRADTWVSRNVVKWIALHTSLPWPKGIRTRPEVDQNIGGTKPLEFEHDRARVADLIQRFVRPDTQYGPHPMFGAMTRDECLLWGYAHVDHHLRQFGV
jgi:hypothetical protein